MKVATFAIILAALTGIAVPIVTIGTLLLVPDTEWIRPLMANKELTASLATLAAASFAALGIFANVQAQKAAVAKEHIEQTERLASALQGEIITIWRLFHEAQIEEMIASIIADLREGRIVAASPRIVDSMDRVFQNDPSCIGWLPVPLPEWTARFYGLYASMAHDMNSLADSIEKSKQEGTLPEMSHWLTQAFAVPLNDARMMQENISWTIPALAAIARGLDLPGIPPQAEMPGTINQTHLPLGRP